MALQIDALPTPPSTGNPSTFDTLADAWVAAIGDWTDQTNDLAEEAEQNAEAAAFAAVTALASANFKGAWSDLTGAAAMPYSVFHAGRYWMLIQNIADITVKVPGVAAEWEELRKGVTPWQRKITTYTAVEGDRIIADTSGGAFTITLPLSPTTGDEVSFSDGGYTSTTGGWAANALTIARNGQTIMGLSENLTCGVRGASFRLVFINSTWEVIWL